MRVTYGGQVFSYEVEGTLGQPLIFLHGWGMSVQSFRSLARYFDKRYRLYLLDLPGFGQAPLAATPLGVADLAGKIRNFGFALQLSSVILVGYGLSGKIMCATAARYSDWVARLIAIDVVGPDQDRILKQAVRRLEWSAFLSRLPVAFELKQKAKQRLMALVGTHDYDMADLMRADLKTLANYDTLAAARLVVTPTTLVWGAKDHRHLGDAKRFYKSLSKSKVVLLPAVGHLDANENPGVFSQGLLSVLG